MPQNVKFVTSGNQIKYQVWEEAEKYHPYPGQKPVSRNGPRNGEMMEVADNDVKTDINMLHMFQKVKEDKNTK